MRNRAQWPRRRGAGPDRARATRGDRGQDSRNPRRPRRSGDPRGTDRRLSRRRHSRQQQRRPALPGFRRDHTREYPQGDRVQHADPDRARPGAGAGHGRTQVRPHRQHHLGFGQGAGSRPRRLVGRARRLDRVPRLRGAALCPPQRHHQFDPARIVRDRPAEIRPRADRGDAEHQRGCRTVGIRRRESRPGGSAIRPSSGRSAPFSPARRPDSSPVRIS